jgi:hypothetical protein
VLVNCGGYMQLPWWAVFFNLALLLLVLLLVGGSGCLAGSAWQAPAAPWLTTAAHGACATAGV